MPFVSTVATEVSETDHSTDKSDGVVVAVTVEVSFSRIETELELNVTVAATSFTFKASSVKSSNKLLFSNSSYISSTEKHSVCFSTESTVEALNILPKGKTERMIPQTRITAICSITLLFFIFTSPIHSDFEFLQRIVRFLMNYAQRRSKSKLYAFSAARCRTES